MPKHPDFHLTARTDIGPYRRGAHIEEKSDVEAILKGEHAAHFVRVAADNKPEGQPAAAPKDPERPSAKMSPEAKI